MSGRFEIRVVVEASRVRERLAEIGAELPVSRRRLVAEVMREALRRTIAGNPVETARSRSAWVAALEALGGVPSADWQGPHGEADAIKEGRAAAEVEQAESSRRSELQAVNGVEYVPFLEYGTEEMAPFEMVRRALVETARVVPQIARGR